MSVSSAQQRASSDSLIIGKWKLKSQVVKRGSKVEYMPMNKIGKWKLSDNGEAIYLFNSTGNSTENRQPYPLENIKYRIIKCTLSELRINGESIWEEVDSASAHLYTSLYIRIK